MAQWNLLPFYEFRLNAELDAKFDIFDDDHMDDYDSNNLGASSGMIPIDYHKLKKYIEIHISGHHQNSEVNEYYTA